MLKEIVTAGLYKQQSPASSLDLLTLAHDTLLEKFSEDYKGKIIPAKKLFWFFGVRWRFKKEHTRQLLKALAERYQNEFEVNCHGLRLIIHDVEGA